MPDNESLDQIKRLLILLLVKLGATSDEIGLALDVEPSGVRKMLPLRKIKKIVKTAED